MIYSRNYMGKCPIKKELSKPGGNVLGIPEGQDVTFELLSYTIIPEPATILLFGLGGLLLRKRR